MFARKSLVFACNQRNHFCPRAFAIQRAPDGADGEANIQTVEDRVARTIRSAIQTIAPGFGVRLWTGELIGPAGGPVVLINDPGLLRRLILRPKLDTLVEAWISKAIDVENGSLFEIVALAPKGKLRHALKRLPKWQLMKDVPALLLSPKASAASGLAGENPFRSGSDKAAITHHYDVSNGFYQTFLDRRMVYTCAYFKDWDNSLDQAQEDKLDHICRKLRLKPGEHLLDIGCGWGALLIHAVKNYGVIGHGVSLSEAQTQLARERIAAEGLSGKIAIDIISYENMAGQFDKISSVGMFEHVGFAGHEIYFSSMARLLKPGGLYLHHAISRRNKRVSLEKRRKGQEQQALAKYIFPGGEVDHLAMSIGNLELHGFEVQDVENLRSHYAKTCRMWAERLHGNFADAAREAGEGKARLWLAYLTACALGFERGTVQVNQTLASRRAPGLPPVPQTRGDLYR
jgi:cyclopropane-fatty-acyl-phospholipid synthase